MERGRRGKRGRVTAPAHAAGRDFLSDLPEEVLHRIMSFLNARQAVRTCLLSRRWRDLWRSVPRVDANFDELSTSQITDGVAEDEAVFKRFVDRLLELRDSTAAIQTFYLKHNISDGGTGSADANRWISHALQKHAQILKVDVELCELQLDHSVFTSSCLTRIALHHVSIDQGFFKQLEMGCPALEVLFMFDCIIGDDEISSNSPKVLTTYMCQFPTTHKSHISAPNVTSLIMNYPENFVPVLNGMASLVTASVELISIVEFDASEMRQLLWSLSGVESLEFNYQAFQLTIESNMQMCPKFINLVHLTLGQWCLDEDFYGLLVFLQNSLRLEKLTLKLTMYNPRGYRMIVGELKERSFMCEHLKSVEIICSKEDEPMAKCVEDLFVESGMDSAQIEIKHWSQMPRHEPALFREMES